MQIRDLGLVKYHKSWQQMLEFTDNRNKDTEDEIWLLEHPPVFTQGKAGKPEHIFNSGDIEVVQSDRGGQVTYHGPGQLVAYILLDLRCLDIGIKTLVHTLESALLELLASYGINANLIPGSPGVYIDNKKIAALGLRVRKFCTLHGLSLNVDMSLEPFIGVSQISEFKPLITMNTVKSDLSQILKSNFNA
jgi:lipoyl(octanoyl) transferase